MDLRKELNELLVDTFNTILKVEENTLTRLYGVDLTMSEFHLIETIAKETAAPKTVSGIAAALNISLPSVTVALQKLEKKGYVEKIKSENDLRSLEVILTEKGNKIKSHHENFHEHMIAQTIKQLDSDEQTVLHKAIFKLNAYFKKMLSAKGEL